MHWPGRVVLQYDPTSGVTGELPAPRVKHFAAPNPFNPRTTIHFSLAEPGFVDVAIYDVHGRCVRELVQRTWMSAGRQRVSWNGTGKPGQYLASGVYLYRITAHDRSFAGKLVLLK